MPARTRFGLGVLAALVVGGAAGYILARLQSPAPRYAQEVVNCYTLYAMEDVLVTRWLREGSDLSNYFDSALGWHVVSLGEAMEALPDADHTRARKALRAIARHRDQHPPIDERANLTEAVSRVLASLPAQTE